MGDISKASASNNQGASNANKASAGTDLYYF